MPRPAVGDKMKTWFSGQPDGMSTILKVTPYTGRYTEHFTWVVRLTAPKTTRGWMEQAV